MGCENWSVLTVLHAVYGFDRIFFGFSFLDDLFYDFAVSNRPQCPPFVSQLFPLGLISMQVELGWVQFLVEKNFYIPFNKFL